MSEVKVKQYCIHLCDLCIAGEGKECHTPGCALWMHNSPGIPIGTEPYGMCAPLPEGFDPAALTLTWRKGKPTVPGMYWFRLRDDPPEDWCIFQVWEQDGKLICEFNYKPIDEMLTGLWAGPIHEPIDQKPT